VFDVIDHLLAGRRRTVLLALVLLLGAASGVLALRARGGEATRTAGVESVPGAGPVEGPGAQQAVAEIGPASGSPSASGQPSASASSSTARNGKLGGKKGVSTYEWNGNRAALADVRVSWYYNWAARRENTPGPATVEFVPMIWGASSVTDGNLAQAKRDGTVLLGFNEPAARWWRSVATGRAAGSTGSCRARGRVGTVSTSSHCTGTAATSGPMPQQAAFVRSSTAMLGSLSYVEWYAWFSLPSTREAGTGLYRDNGSPTEAGSAYRSA
jgi:hypothetical protein